MSIAKNGDEQTVKTVVDQSKELLAAAAAEEEQLDLLEQPTPEELLEAREELGPDAGRLSIVRHAREKRRGRPKGVRNRRTEDFARYILSFGQDPAITMMQIQSTPPELLVEASKRMVTRMSKAGNPVLLEEAMTYEAAQSLRIRCAEGIMPYIHSKQPVAADVTIRGVRVVEEMGGNPATDLIDGGLLRVAGPEELEEAIP